MTMEKGSGISLLLLLILLMNTPETCAEPSATYVGWKNCETCHPEIAGSWQNTRHAKAIESLKKSKQETLPACVKCHVTGYEKDGGFIDNELTPEMAGVQCEVCHGPGSDHVEIWEEVYPKKTLTPEQQGRAQLPIPNVDNCLKCHQQVTQQLDFNNHFHVFLSRWQARDTNAATCVSCHQSHQTNGETQLAFLNRDHTVSVCQSCHRALGEGE